jgi:chemotaxis protein methyltransferase CheR
MEKIKSPILAYFADYIEKETGIIYSEGNAYQLENRLSEIAKALSLETIEQLYELSKGSGLYGTPKQLLLDTATNNGGSFFRDPKIFKAFEKVMLPQAITLAGTFDSVKIWSVASSFGQEPYSLSMIIEQQIEEGKQLRNAEILTTDISKRALERVSKGIYSQLEVQRGLPANLLVKYFEKTDLEQWQLKPQITKRVSSQHMNLLHINSIQKKYHVIFCRNVLIYQNDLKKRQIIEQLSSYLEPGGFFVLGAAESLIGLSDKFDQEIYESAVFYKKKAA